MNRQVQSVDVGSYLWLVICFFMVSGCATIFPSGGADSDADELSERDSQRSPQIQKRIELQASLMSFADRFAAEVYETTTRVESGIESPELRLLMAQARFYSASSIYGIVSGPYIGVALFDTLVLVTLKRILLEEYWLPQVLGDKGEPILETYQRLEEDIWSIAAKYMTPEQQQDLQDVIIAWRENNPHKVGVDFIRFDDFGALGRKPTFEEARKPGGLLAPVSEATRAVDEVRLLGERALFLLTRSQMLLNLQADVTFRQLINEPEVRQVLADIHTISNVSDDYAKIMSDLPQELRMTTDSTIEQIATRVTAERREAIQQLMTRLTQERKQLFADIAAEEQRFGRILTELRQTLAAGTGLMTEVNRAMAVAEPLLASVGAKESGRHFDAASLEEVTAASRQVTEMVNALEGLLGSPAWEVQVPRLIEVMSRVESESQKIVDSVFRKTLVLILLLTTFVLIALLIYRFATERLIKKNG